jgi:4-hydroxy-2-oxoheptanedioate aldolase
MLENRLRTIWANGGAAVNGWMAIPSSFAAEIMARQGFDSVVVDLQHGMIDYSQMVPMLQAISQTPTVPLVRVPWLEPGILMKTLDAGAFGVICPMVGTVDDAAALVRFTRYPKLGQRSNGPIRAAMLHGADYQAKANQSIVVLAMIETAEAVDNLDAILGVEGLDGVYIGPSDLSLAYGCRPVFDDLDPPAAQAVEHILARCKAHGVRCGIHNGEPPAAKERIAKGFDLVTLGHDSRLIAAGAKAMLTAVRG